MKPYLLRLGIGCCTLTLLWCAKNLETNIIFDTYTLVVQTPFHYQEITTNEASIIKSYSQTPNITSWFTSSLLIAKQEVTSGTTALAFANKNTKIELATISKGEMETNKEIKTTCHSGTILGQITTLHSEKQKENYYLSQYYFVDKGYGYIISLMTSNSTENKDFIKSIKSLSCL